MSDSVAVAAIGLLDAMLALRQVRLERARLRCEMRSAGEDIGGGRGFIPGHAACRDEYANTEDYCEPCRQRQATDVEWSRVTSEYKRAWRRAKRAAERGCSHG